MTIIQHSEIAGCVDFLLSQRADKRVREQRKAKDLLFKKIAAPPLPKSDHYLIIAELKAKFSPASEIFIPESVQKKIYSGDTGTHLLPSLFKKILANIKLSFIFRPGNIKDLQVFVEYAYLNKIHYTIRGTGTWPFGGCVPMNNDVIVDLSNLDFKQIDMKQKTITVGAGVIFPDARKYLHGNGYVLRQEITNPGSGTIAGWIATGGLGLGSYKYGHIAESVLMLLVIKPNGHFITLTPADEDFDNYFGSEGHFGIIAGATLKIRQDSYVTKPYAFSFDTPENACLFMEMLDDLKLQPTSIIYYDHSYIQQIYKIEKGHIEKRSADALRTNDQLRLAEAREDYDDIEELQNQTQVVILHFDKNSDYQQALKTRIFGASGELGRVNHIKFRQLSTFMAHHLWAHRFLPVQMKQNGPSMLVSETILPFSSFENYQNLVGKILSRLLDIELKTEALLLQNREILVQSIFLADTRTFRHKIYFALVPLMIQISHYLEARPYGIGFWNYMFVNRLRQLFPEKVRTLTQFKKNQDPHGIINQGKFLNPRGQKFLFKVFKILTPRFNQWIISTFHKRQQGKKYVLSYPIERIVWNLSKILFPRIVPSALKADSKEPISNIISPCAECDSCERVCPTSDIFGLYGPATPIARLKTASRVIQGEDISTEEALGFLVCTRCDQCVRICPTDIPLTEMFDLVEKNDHFQQALDLTSEEKQDFINRFWQIMIESPLYKKHTLAEQKEDKSHLLHGHKILYEKGFEYGHLFIDPLTCIRCGICAHENACMYGARYGNPRRIPELININCSLCNACVNFCPQNKAFQQDRQFYDKLIYNAVDLEEKKYWIKQQNRIHDTTKVNRSTQLTEMADRYVTEEIIMEIDKEAASGQIPVSGMGQGDRHMGIGFDAERFAHFHIVGPAQNRLHEGDPDEELSVILGKREDFCKFNREGNLVNPQHPIIKLKTPILYNSILLESNGKLELVLIKVAQGQKSLVVIKLERLLEHYQFLIKEGSYDQLPAVIIPRVDHELIHRIIVNPNTNREFLTDLWRMPMFEVEYHPDIGRTLNYIKDSVAVTGNKIPLICGCMEISEYDLIGSLTLTTEVKEKVHHFLDHKVDIFHVHGLRNKDQYYVTSSAVRALHRYLMRIGRRHEVSIIASGGIRLASDSQKTIQRGAEATLIDLLFYWPWIRQHIKRSLKIKLPRKNYSVWMWIRH